MGFQRAGHHKRCLKLRKGVSWVGGTPVVYLSILESPCSIPRVTCFRMDFLPCCVAPQVSGGQQSRQLQVAQSCVARRWHLREPANGATGDDLCKQDVTTRQPIIYSISIWKVHGYLMIRYTSVCLILQEHLKQSISDIKWYPWKAFYYPETSPTSPCGKMTSLWHLLTGFPYSNCALQSSGEVWRDLSWTKLIITSSWEGWVVLSELISHDQPAGLTSDLYWNG